MKTFCIGDIHGAHKALLQCLERSGFDKEEDTLITLGDIVDGWSDVYECVQEILSIKNRIDIRGNHDEWFQQFILTGMHGSQWQQGANATRDSYGKRSMMIPESHIKFFYGQHNYYIDEKNRLFVHGGFDRFLPIRETSPHEYYWDRELWEQAKSCKKGKLNTVDNFEQIYIGHTSCVDKKNPEALPITRGGVTNLDTGAGWYGKLTIMNVDTREYFQSDWAQELYKGEKGRI